MTRRSFRIQEAMASMTLLVLVAAVSLVPMPNNLGISGQVTAALGGENVQVPPANVVLSCPGPLVTPLGTTAATFALNESQTGAQSVVLPSSARVATGEQTAALATLVGKSPLTALSPEAIGKQNAPLTVLAEVPDAQAGEAGASPAGAVSYVASTGDQQGVVTSQCSEPATDQWLVAGDASAGSTTTVVLNNPGLTTVTANLELWGAAGKIAASTNATQVIAAGQSVGVVVGAIAPSERRVVVHVTTTGGDIAASLTQSRLDGLVPRGVDQASASAEPARSQVIPGVSLAASEVDDADAGLLRLLAPEASTTATVKVIGANGQVVLRGASTVALTAGQVTDVSLAGVPAGDYTIVVTADQPVVASARIVRAGSAVTSTQGSLQVALGTSADFAWVPSTSALLTSAVGSSDSTANPQTSGTVAVPAGITGTVVIGAVPDLTTVAGRAVLDKVPVTYGTDTTSTGAAVTATAVQRGTVTAYDASGAVVGTQAVNLSAAGTTAVALSTLAPGKTVAAVRVSTEGAKATDSSLAWSLVTTATSVPGSIGVLTPLAVTAASSTVLVKAVDSF